MPRKSIFRKKNKVKKNDKEESISKIDEEIPIKQEPIETPLQRSNAIDIKAMEDIKEIVEESKVEIKKAPVKKKRERKSRRNRRTKKEDEPSVSMTVDQSMSIVEPLTPKPEPLPIVEPPKPVKKTIKKEEKPAQKQENKKDDILAKLAALQKERDVEIKPIKKVEEKVAPPPKVDIFAKLKELENQRKKAFENKPEQKPKQVEQKVIKEKSVSVAKSTNEALLLANKKYLAKITENTNDDIICKFALYSARDQNKKCYEFEYNKNTDLFYLFQYNDGVRSRAAKVKLNKDSFTIKLQITNSEIIWQVTGQSQQRLKRHFTNRDPINKCSWTFSSLKLI